MSEQNFARVIALAESGAKFPVMSLVRNDPGMAALLSKLHAAALPSKYDKAGNRETTAPQLVGFKEISDQTAQDATDAETVMQILPDMELTAQILVSSVLAPKDMTTTELTYSVTEGLIEPDVSAALIGVVKHYFEQDYKIKPLLPKMLRDVLFETGSYSVAVIPENSVDEMINSHAQLSLESFRENINTDGSLKSIGLLGPAQKNRPTQTPQRPGLSLESFEAFAPDTTVDGLIRFENAKLTHKVEDSFVSVTDNLSLLKIPNIHQKIREQRILRSIGSKAMESFRPPTRPQAKQGGKINDRELSGLLYKNRAFSYTPIATLKTQQQLARRTIGNPLIMHLPSESVIPVHVPGTPEAQVGFFVLIDAEGNPISKSDRTDYYQELQQRLKGGGSFASAMLNKVQGQMNGFDLSDRRSLDYSARAYSEMIEQDLLARLRNGVYGNGVALAKNEEVYRIMLSRALAKQHTQLLFIPVELMTYFAFRFDKKGIGKSLLDDMKILNSLRAMLLFANTMASIKNSIGRTEVKLKLDEDDPNPQRSIEIAMHEIVRSRQTAFPIGVNSPTDVVDYLQKASVEFTYENHPGMPDVSADFGERASSFAKPDTELEESLRKRSIMAAGLSPETVDQTTQVDFATSVVQNSILLAKRVTQIQEQFVPLLADHLRKVLMNSENVIKELRAVLEANFDKLTVEPLTKGDRQQDAQNKAEAGSSPAATQAALNLRPSQIAATKEAEPAQKVDPERNKKAIIDQFLHEFVMNLEVALPQPNSVTLENQVTAMETYAKALDMGLDAWLSSKFYTDATGGEVASNVDAIKEVMKAYFLRQWMAENGVLPELSALTTTDSKGAPSINLFDLQQEHLESLTKTLTKLMVGLQPRKNLADDTLERNGVDAGAGGGGGDSYGGGDAGGGGGDEFDLGGGDDSGDGADGGGGDDAPPPDDAAPDDVDPESNNKSPDLPAGNDDAPET